MKCNCGVDDCDKESPLVRVEYVCCNCGRKWDLDACYLLDQFDMESEWTGQPQLAFEDVLCCPCGCELVGWETIFEFEHVGDW
jgi:hypothetical protein